MARPPETDRVASRPGSRLLRTLETFAADLRFAFRLLSRSPGFSLAALLTLGLGIGANTAIFSLIQDVLLKRLPVRDPDRLVVIASRSEEGRLDYSFSYPMYEDLRDRADAFSGVIALAGTRVNLAYGGASEQASGELVSGNYFETLGVQPWLGRLLTPADDVTQGGHPVVVLSYGYWRRRFGGDASLVGQSIVLNGQPMTVIGVTPPGFYGTELGRAVDLRVPMKMATVFRPFPANRLQSRRHQWLTMMARLRDGQDRPVAAASAELVYRQIQDFESGQLPSRTSDFERRRFLARRLELLPGSQGRGLARQVLGRPLLLLQGVTLLVLLIACANVANMLLARNAARRQELAVRVALGAGRGRLLRQWLTESILLALAGVPLGLLFAVWTRAALRAALPSDRASVFAAELDGQVLGFAVLAGILVGVAAGLAPAWRASRAQTAAALKSEAPTLAGTERVFSLRGGLVLAQMALSLPLLVTAGLLLRSLDNLRSIDPGFVPEHVLLGTLDPSLNGYAPERVAAYYREVVADVGARPGVSSVALAESSAISGGWDQLGVGVEGYTPREGENMSPNANLVTPRYFETLGIPFVAGRDFAETDTLGAPRVAIVNETMARYFFGERSPLGRRITLEPGPGAVYDIEIVGVVKDSKYVQLREAPRRHFYLPVWQTPRLFELTLHVRARGATEPAAAQLRAALQRVDASVPLYHVTSLEAQVDDSLSEERLITWLCLGFGALAAGLACIGTYSVVAFSVARRVRELGIRVALGASRRDVVLLVIGQMGGIVGLGLLLGLLAAAGLSRLLGSLLYEIAPIDLATYAGAGLLLGLVALGAAYLPARRAAGVDPARALRYE